MNILNTIIPWVILNLLFVLIFIPITIYIFKNFKRKLDLIEIAFFSILISIVVLPLIAFILNFFIPFNNLLAIIAILVPLTISVFLLSTKKINIEKIIFTKSSLVILFLVFLTFYLRIQSLSSFYSEADPYFYEIGTREIIKDGFITQKTFPLNLYLTSIWYNFLQGESYNNLNNMYIRNIYPPLFGALIVFLGFFFFKDLYGSWIGVGSAFIFAFIPQLLQIFKAGVSEEFPWGLSFCFFTIVFLHYAISHKNKGIFLMFLIMLIGSLLGSKAGFVPLIISICYIGLMSIKDFIFKIKNTTYHEISFFILIVVLLSNFIFGIYSGNIKVIEEKTILIFLVFISTLFLYKIQDMGLFKKIIENRMKFIGLLGIIGLVFMLTIGLPLSEYLINLNKYGQGDNPKLRIYAEENFNHDGSNLAKYFGTIGLSANILLDSPLKILNSENATVISIPIIFVAFLLVFARGFFANKNYLLLIFIFIISISTISLLKVKFFPYLALILSVALTCVMGELKEIIKEKESRNLLFIILIIVSVMLFHAFLFYLHGSFSFFTNSGELFLLSVNSILIYLIFVLCFIALIYYSYSFYKKSEYDKTLTLIILIFILPFVLKYIEVLPYSIEYLSLNGTDYMEVHDFCEKVNNSFVAEGLYCTIIPKYEYEAFEFIKNNIKENKIVFFEDIKYRTKFYTGKESVETETMEIAYLFVNENEKELWEYMNKTNTNYVIFSRDILAKWGALTYLYCYYNEKIGLREDFKNNECMNENEFEIIYISHEEVNRCKEGNNYGIHYCIMYDSFLSYEKFESDEEIQIMERTYLINGTNYILKIKEDVKKAYNSVFYKGLIQGKLRGFEKIYKNDEISSIAIYKRIENVED